MNDRLKIITPPGWGHGLPPHSNEGIELALGMQLDPSYKAEVEGRLSVEKEMRQRMENAGVKLVEIQNPAGLRQEINPNEFRVRGKQMSPEEEMALIREVVPTIRVPEAFTVDQFLQRPFFPAVLYYEGKSKGEGKYLLDNEAQWERFVSFLTNEAHPELRNRFKLKQFIHTPGDRYTSYRVITSCTGHILAAGLLYSGQHKNSKDLVTSDLDLAELEGISMHSLLRYLEIPDSPYFLAAKRITSNVAGGGNIISLNPTANSCALREGELEILPAHGIGKDRQLPAAMARKAELIGMTLGRRSGLFVGIDFIQDEDQKEYYLEMNGEPGMDTYLMNKNNGQGTAVDGYRMAMNEVISELIGQKVRKKHAK